MDGCTTKRTGKERTAAYRARLDASGEPPTYVVTRAISAAFLEARIRDRVVDAVGVLQRAAEIVTAEPDYTQEGFENVLVRLTQPSDRRRRFA
jgi:hypothetical protein